MVLSFSGKIMYHGKMGTAIFISIMEYDDKFCSENCYECVCREALSLETFPHTWDRKV